MKVLIVCNAYIIQCGLTSIMLRNYIGVKITVAADRAALFKALAKDDYDLLIVFMYGANKVREDLAKRTGSVSDKNVLYISHDTEGHSMNAATTFQHTIPADIDEAGLLDAISRCVDEDRSIRRQLYEGVVPVLGRLSPREYEILQYLLRGWKTSDIARTYNIAASTVSTFKSRILTKMNVDSVGKLSLLYYNALSSNKAGANF